jgi:hypothetical protein
MLRRFASLALVNAEPYEDSLEVPLEPLRRPGSLGSTAGGRQAGDTDDGIRIRASSRICRGVGMYGRRAGPAREVVQATLASGAMTTLDHLDDPAGLHRPFTTRQAQLPPAGGRSTPRVPA